MKYLYLLVDLAALAVPFIFSFHRKILFYREWKFFLPVLILVTILFCLWDILFTAIGIWGFSQSNTTGIKISILPLEEVLFFLCIPYSCVFTYHCFRLFLVRNPFPKSSAAAFAFSFALVIAAIIFYNRLYPLITFSALAVLLLLVKKKQFLGIFFISCLFLLIPFLIINGILTGTGLTEPVVWYNENEIIGFRIFTIPVEDIFYGMLLMLVNVAGMEWLKSRSA